jgi:hypothetical protein
MATVTKIKKAKKKVSRIQSGRELSDFIEDFVKDLPKSVFDTLPKDGAEYHDHYLYSTPKQK